MNETIKNIISCIADNDIQKAKSHIKVLIANDETKANQQFNARIKSKLELSTSNFLELPYDIKGILKMEDVSVSFNEDRYFLSDSEKELFDKISTTKKAVDKISNLGLHYLNTTLLYGESGTGKTSFGRYVAYKLGLPFAYLNFSECISSYLGVTGKNISKVFDYIKNQKCVLMLDEIDAIAITRDKSNEVGEMARIVIGLMQAFDMLSNDVIVIGATNRKDLLDVALLRRFSLKHEIKRLTDRDALLFVKQFINSLNGCLNEFDIERYVKQCGRLQSEIINDIISKIIMEELNNKQNKPTVSFFYAGH